ncbi:MAG: hypothetical protein V3V19_10890 [Cocleimonas sp.]
MISKLRSRLIFISILLLLTACGSGGDGEPSSGDSKTSTGLPSDINGLIVLNVEGEVHDPHGTYKIDFNKGQVKTHRFLTSQIEGINPYAHDRNTITYAEPCGSDGYQHSRIKIINEKGLSSAQVVVPCSSTLFQGPGVLLVAKISPDKSKIAIEVNNGTDSGTYLIKYIVKVFDINTGEELSSYRGYESPEWLPDGRLLVSSSALNDESKGIFITSKDFENLTRIDGGVLNQNVSFLSVNLLGDRLIFTMSGRVWMMNIDSNHALSHFQELISGNGTTIQTPIWSPDGKYIAFLSFSGSGRSIWHAGRSAKNITFWNISLKKSYVFDLTTIFPLRGSSYHVLGPAAYMSWVE